MGGKVQGSNESVKEIRDVHPNIRVIPNSRLIEFPKDIQVVGGTVSQLIKLDSTRCDYLFVDEASQVVLPVLCAMATKVENIVLIGDQKQLPAPVESVWHAGESGQSCLEYFTRGKPVIDPELGFFLDTTYRMNAALTKVISSNYYENQLKSCSRSCTIHNFPEMSLLTH